MEIRGNMCRDDTNSLMYDIISGVKRCAESVRKIRKLKCCVSFSSFIAVCRLRLHVNFRRYIGGNVVDFNRVANSLVLDIGKRSSDRKEVEIANTDASILLEAFLITIRNPATSFASSSDSIFDRRVKTE